MWNAGTARYTEAPLFVYHEDASLCKDDDKEKLASIVVISHHDCRARKGKVVVACLNADASLNVEKMTWTGQMEVRLIYGDDEASGRDFDQLVVNIAHELGHALGLAHYYCTNALNDPAGGNRLLIDMRAVMNGETKEPMRDEETGVLNPYGGPCIVRGEPRLTEVDIADFMRAYYGEPFAPAGLKAVPGDGRVTWSWDKASDAPEIDYYEFRISGGQWRRIVGSDANTTAHRQLRLSNDTQYTAEFRAVRGHVRGRASAVVATPTTLVVPTNVMLSVSNDDLTATFSWQGTAPRFLRWQLHRGLSREGAFAAWGGIPDDSESPVEFKDVKRGFWYKLQGQACEYRQDLGGASGDDGVEGEQSLLLVCGKPSEFSDPVEILPLGVCVPSNPGPVGSSDGAGATATACIPSGETFDIVEANTETTYNSITFKWTESVGATKYEVRMRLKDSSTDVKTATLSDSTKRSHKFDGLKPGTMYVVGVRGVNEFADSGWQEDEATTDPTPAPTGLTVSAVSDTGATLHWQKPDDEIADFVVQLDGVDVDTSVGDVLSFSFDTDDGFTANTAHKLGVASIHNGVRSTFTELTLLLPPTLNTPTATQSSITLNWATNEGGLTFELRQVSGNEIGNCNNSLPDDLNDLGQTSGTSFTFSSLSSNTEYRSCVRSLRTTGEGDSAVTLRSAWASVKSRTSSPPPPSCGPRPQQPDDEEQTIDVGDDTRWVTSGVLEVEQTSDLLQNQERSPVWSGLPDCKWGWGAWRNVGDPYNGPWTATGARRCKEPLATKPSGSKTDTIDTNFRWDVRGDVAYYQPNEQKQDYIWETDWEDVPTCGWVNGRWVEDGEPYWTGWTDTGEPLTKPDDYVLGPFPSRDADADVYRWVVVFGPNLSCREHQEVSEATRWTTSSITYSWGGSNWTPKVGSSFYHTYGAYKRTGETRACNFARSGVAATSGGYTLSAGDYVLEWSDTRIEFTVPTDASVSLAWRLVSEEYVAVFTKGDAEMLVTAQALDGTSGQDTPEDSALASVAASLRLPQSDQPASSVATSQQCVVATRAESGATTVNLDSGSCVVVLDGGDVKVVLGSATRSLSLPSGRDWLLTATLGENQTPAIAIVDLQEGGYVIIRAADGTELSRHVPVEDSQLLG